MKNKNGAFASTGSACLKKVTELFYVTHPKVHKALLGPFLTEADAECGCVVLRSDDVQVESRQVKTVDAFTYGHAVNNGQVCRLFAGAEVSHE